MPQYGQIQVLKAENTSKTLAAGFASAAFRNFGSNAATLTMGTESWTLPAGDSYTIPERNNTALWLAVTITATTTTVECTYFK